MSTEMQTLNDTWRADDAEHELRFARVAGTGGQRLRGGCHHNWDIHCTVWWRYGITPDAHDGCIGFRLALAPV